MAELAAEFLRANLAAALAIILVATVRGPARRMAGAGAAYGLWLLPALAFAALFLPGPTRTVLLAPVQLAPLMAAPMPVTHDIALPSSTPMAAVGPSLGQILAWVWALGFLAMLVVTGLAQRRSEADVRQGRLGPAVIGVFAPRIVLPDDFAHRYSAGEQALVLAHERAHLDRQDARINGLAVLAQCVCWFNPLIHLGAYLLRIDQELACDEAVISRFPSARRDYAEALVKAQLAIRPLPLGCYWPSGTEHPLVERLAMINQNLAGRPRRLAGASAVVLLCAGASYAAWAAQPARVIAVPAAAAHAAVPAISSPADKVLSPALLVLAQSNPATAAGSPPRPAPPASVSPISAEALGSILYRECFMASSNPDSTAVDAMIEDRRRAAEAAGRTLSDVEEQTMRRAALGAMRFSVDINALKECSVRIRTAVRPPQQTAAIAEAIRTNNLGALMRAGGMPDEAHQILGALCGQSTCGRRPEDGGGLWMVAMYQNNREFPAKGSWSSGGFPSFGRPGSPVDDKPITPVDVEVRLQCTLGEETRLTGCRLISKNPPPAGYLERALDAADYFQQQPPENRPAPQIALTVHFYTPDGFTATWARVS